MEARAPRPCISHALCGKNVQSRRWSSPQPPRFWDDDSYQLIGENSIVLDFLLVSLGAIAGANARYFLSRYAARLLGPVFPYGTLIINVTGSLIVGFFVIWTTERVLADPRWRLLVVVGFCGAFTTFSRYALQTMAYLEQGQGVFVFP